jgi:phosphoribosyl 1,2-cyclic phosphodiesterase
MEVVLYGTRGSIPIANKASIETGGNTTCLRIKSACLPQGKMLVVDGGSGFVPLSFDALKEGIKSVDILMTHYHHDHTQGIPLSPLTFIKQIPITIWGPTDRGIGPKEVLETLMKPPFFPVDFKSVASHWNCHKIDQPNTQVFVIHPQGGIVKMGVDKFDELEKSNRAISMGDGKYPKSECLVIRMLRSNHLEQTVSYRFEEGPTGKAFVFLTDHENQDGIPNDLRAHLQNADLLVMDSQYTREKYEKMTAGFGHGTPDYCVRTAVKVGVKRLGLTHHDPSSTDKAVIEIMEEGRKTLEKEGQQVQATDPKAKLSLAADRIFVCHDYDVVTV